MSDSTIDSGASCDPRRAEAPPADRGARPLRVLGVDPERGFAGGETQVLGLTLALKRAGHTAHLACDPNGTLIQRAQREGVTCIPLAIRNAVDVLAGLHLRRIVAGGDYDIVHFHTSRAHAMAPFIGRALAARVVTRRMDYPPNRLFAPWLYNHAVDGIAAISAGVADALVSSGVERDRITIIPSGVDCDRFRPASVEERRDARRRLGLSENAFVIGSVGMLEPRKGHGFLIEAFASVAKNPPRPDLDLACVIAGGGSERSELESQAARSGPRERVIFAGKVADSRGVLDALDLFVLPSLREGLGVALLEAMACGLPSIVSRTGGAAEAIEDGVSGLLAEPGDAQSIAMALCSLMRDDAMRIAMGAAARKRAMVNFSMEGMAEATLALYRRVLARR